MTGAPQHFAPSLVCRDGLQRVVGSASEKEPALYSMSHDLRALVLACAGSRSDAKPCGLGNGGGGCG